MNTENVNFIFETRNSEFLLHFIFVVFVCIV